MAGRLTTTSNSDGSRREQKEEEEEDSWSSEQKKTCRIVLFTGKERNGEKNRKWRRESLFNLYTSKANRGHIFGRYVQPGSETEGGRNGSGGHPWSTRRSRAPLAFPGLANRQTGQPMGDGAWHTRSIWAHQAGHCAVQCFCWWRRRRRKVPNKRKRVTRRGEEQPLLRESSSEYSCDEWIDWKKQKRTLD